MHQSFVSTRKGWGIYIYVFGILKEMPHRGNAPTPKDSVVKIEEY